MRVLGLLLGVVLLLAGCAEKAPPPEKFQFTAKTLEGAEFRGDKLVGHPAVLWFWTPWCPSCNAEAAKVAKTAERHDRVQFVGVAAQDQLDAMKKFVSDHGMTGFPHLADLDGAVWKRFGVTAQPTLAFVGSDGSVELLVGAPTEEQLDQRVSALTPET
ncbi:Thiol-disulfide isomerase or thioredoxin [Lentzea xinjiangensis]|uniref:Thiol-disulfide isomerase or thioredoxin n=1 Tax=Lentzea xinjiangensis TaxID=402600 RepID=A0A1H9M6A6_9PSEU|nr:redoxin domain-containing protein [Lentzea xinjiangensis]SER19162.1 Thiol-disulfide isomerase or thioredoxin [Lentzea xinjiangensis]